jgi:hypothetical protein
LGLTNPKVRLYIYAVVLAALAVAIVYGIIAADKAPVWIGLLSAILGLVPPAIAIPNVPKQNTDSAPVPPVAHE